MCVCVCVCVCVCACVCVCMGLAQFLGFPPLEPPPGDTRVVGSVLPARRPGRSWSLHPALGGRSGRSRFVPPDEEQLETCSHPLRHQLLCAGAASVSSLGHFGPSAPPPPQKVILVHGHTYRGLSAGPRAVEPHTKTAPFQLQRGAAPIDLCRDAAPIDLCRDAAPIDLYREAAPIDLYRDAAPIDLCRDAAPIDLCRDAAPMCLCAHGVPSMNRT